MAKAKAQKEAPAAKGPQRHVRSVWKWLIASYLMGMTLLCVFMVIHLWPASASQIRGGAHSGGVDLLWVIPLPAESRLILLVAFAGAVGAQVHAMRSFVTYVGTRRLENSWLLYYIAKPFIGSSLALVFYFVIRGGFFSGSAGTDDMSVFGFVGLAGLVGLFSELAAVKLETIAGTIFEKPKEKKDE